MNIKPHPDTDLTQDQLEVLVNRLTGRRFEFVAMLDRLVQQIAARDDCSVADAAEAASLQEDRLRAGSVADQYRQTIMEIDLALDRLNRGNYGISESSGKSIPYERLLLVPWARTGVDE